MNLWKLFHWKVTTSFSVTSISKSMMNLITWRRSLIIWPCWTDTRQGPIARDPTLTGMRSANKNSHSVFIHQASEDLICLHFLLQMTQSDLIKNKIPVLAWHCWMPSLVSSSSLCMQFQIQDDWIFIIFLSLTCTHSRGPCTGVLYCTPSFSWVPRSEKNRETYVH